MTAEPRWFGPDERPLFGWLHRPDNGRARGGVVLCPPIADEERRVYSTYRKLAEALERAGFCVLRFNYDGTGDSAGSLDDLDRVGAWLASIRSAVRLVQSAGVTHVTAVGMRIGATLISHVASSDDELLDAVVLWDPCAQGRDFLRYQQALMTTLPGVPSTDASGVDTPGYFIPAAVAEELRSLEIRPITGSTTRTLLMARADRPAPRRLERALAGTAADDLDAVGQGELLDVSPLNAVIPWTAIEQITAWIADVAPTDELPVTAPGSVEAIVGVDAHGSPIRERAVRLGSIGLFAMVTEPASPGPGPLMAFLNVASEHHIGPGRQWVELARSWAGHGLRSVRFDVSGVGDSPVHPGQEENITYAREWLDDIPEVITALSPGNPSNAVFIGLCSGGYTAFESGLQLGAVGAYVLNPSVSSDNMIKGAEEFDPRRRACRQWPGWLARLAVDHGRTAIWLWKAYCQIAPGRAPMAVPALAVREGMDVLVLCGEEDAVQFRETAYWRRFGEPRLRRTSRFDLTVVPDMDHVLLFGAGRSAGTKILTERVVARFGSVPPAAPPGHAGGAEPGATDQATKGSDGHTLSTAPSPGVISR